MTKSIPKLDVLEALIADFADEKILASAKKREFFQQKLRRALRKECQRLPQYLRAARALASADHLQVLRDSEDNESVKAHYREAVQAALYLHDQYAGCVHTLLGVEVRTGVAAARGRSRSVWSRQQQQQENVRALDHALETKVGKRLDRVGDLLQKLVDQGEAVTAFADAARKQRETSSLDKKSTTRTLKDQLAATA